MPNPSPHDLEAEAIAPCTMECVLRLIPGHDYACPASVRPAIAAALRKRDALLSRAAKALEPFAQAADDIGECGEPELVHIWAAVNVDGGEVGDWVSSNLRQSDLLVAASTLAAIRELVPEEKEKRHD